MEIPIESVYKVPSVNVDYAKVRGVMYVAKDAQDAKDYVKEHGGVIMHDIGLNKLMVFPESVRGFCGQIKEPMTED